MLHKTGLKPDEPEMQTCMHTHTQKQEDSIAKKGHISVQINLFTDLRETLELGVAHSRARLTFRHFRMLQTGYIWQRDKSFSYVEMFRLVN